MIIRTVTRRKMRRLRRQANATYRLARWQWDELSVHERVWACAMLESVGSPHRLATSWGTNAGIQIVYRERRS